MKKSMRIVSLLLCTVMLLTLLGGCGKKKEDDRRATNEIVVGISQDLDESLDPHTLTSAGGRELLFNVFEGLVKPTPAGELECAVASKYELSPDGLTYTFTLRDGITFHNGKAVTMDDVVYSIERCRDENLVAGLEQIVGLDHTDDTLTITLPKPNAEFLSCLTLAIIPQDYADQATAPVGTGPFRFVSRTAQQSIVLERFADYWGEGAKLDRVTYRIFENPDALVMALKGGAVDLYAHLPSNYASQLTEGFQIIEGTMNLVQAVYLNNAVEPLNNEKVRQALCYAIDREEIFNMTADG
ncbi:MAG: ABC transporter substrate-binding protein, partial [Oscillospiraceae bacterium]|nr:ABC transporter substrate-binding protein [Oscillospiraceae bacterium]